MNIVVSYCGPESRLQGRSLALSIARISILVQGGMGGGQGQANGAECAQAPMSPISPPRFVIA